MPTSRGDFQHVSLQSVLPVPPLMHGVENAPGPAPPRILGDQVPTNRLPRSRRCSPIRLREPEPGDGRPDSEAASKVHHEQDRDFNNTSEIIAYWSCAPGSHPWAWGGRQCLRCW